MDHTGTGLAHQPVTPQPIDEKRKKPHIMTRKVSPQNNLHLNSNANRKPPDPNPRKKKSPKHCATRCFCYSDIQRTFSQQYDDTWAPEFEFENSKKRTAHQRKKTSSCQEVCVKLVIARALSRRKNKRVQNKKRAFFFEFFCSNNLATTHTTSVSPHTWTWCGKMTP